MSPHQNPRALGGRSLVPSEHPWSTRPALGCWFPFEKEQGFALGQDPSSVPGASSLLARAGLGCRIGPRERFPKQIFAQRANTWERAGAFALPAPGGGSQGASLGPEGFTHALTCRCAELPRFPISLCSVGLHKEAFHLYPCKGAALWAGPGKPHRAPGQGCAGEIWCPALPCYLCQSCSKFLGSPRTQIHSKTLLCRKLSHDEQQQHRVVGAGHCTLGADACPCWCHRPRCGHAPQPTPNDPRPPSP